jgi:hypothetical protein
MSQSIDVILTCERGHQEPAFMLILEDDELRLIGGSSWDYCDECGAMNPPDIEYDDPAYIDSTRSQASVEGGYAQLVEKLKELGYEELLEE